jgi:hypothetical protein
MHFFVLSILLFNVALCCNLLLHIWVSVCQETYLHSQGLVTLLWGSICAADTIVIFWFYTVVPITTLNCTLALSVCLIKCAQFRNRFQRYQKIWWGNHWETCEQGRKSVYAMS